MRILLLVCLMVGVAQAETPTQIAKKLLDAQLAAMKGAQSSTFETAFPADTVVGATDGGTSKVADGLGMVRSGIANNMLAVISTTKVLSLTAGGDAKVVWFSGEVEIGTEQQTGPRSITKNKHVVRFTELAVADGAKWKVVAAEFGRPGTPPRDDYGSSIQGETKRGTMTKFLLDPKQMAFQLDAKDATAVVFGTDKGEKAVGYAAAKKLLESWKGLKLEIDGDVREVEGSSWGFVHANVKWLEPGGPPYRMRALAIATKEPSQPWVFRAIQFAVP